MEKTKAATRGKGFRWSVDTIESLCIYHSYVVLKV